MVQTVVLLPLLNFLGFVFFGSKVYRSQLASFAIASMGVTLLCIILYGSDAILGKVVNATVGTWATSEMFEIN
jgi:NADH:ubiquinone oxidoreductase subunit 5 (subunit L)/multisubunit Na+/H+ antiporter MnhA subunit